MWLGWTRVASVGASWRQDHLEGKKIRKLYAESTFRLDLKPKTGAHNSPFRNVSRPWASLGQQPLQFVSLWTRGGAHATQDAQVRPIP